MTDDILPEQVKIIAEDCAVMPDDANAGADAAADGKEIQLEAEAVKEEEKPLPKLSAAEFQQYNRLATTMNQYHDHFRSVWNELSNGCKTSRPKNQSLRQFLGIAEGFCRMLETHHNIEETYVFPVLAKRMPAFQKHNKQHGEMIAQHRLIHKGLDRFSDHIGAVRSGEKDFVASEMLEVMESFEKVLWQHLDEEVVQLGAENMRKYWALDELHLLPM
ncbi:hypothetical protein DRE_02239 [Drechslerella stenobrocha 248]|uniref:Hemerythrin-like domain-containing protein n=1 Tax=Drechslerella stenobrocha 248 TaxID=1043628 RepID=W7IGZ2_9PEZI|nr:hypothetical protein DRE_02239 [Drechslerella stenobrocha 248]